MFQRIRQCACESSVKNLSRYVGVALAALLGVQSVHAAGSTAAINLKLFTPDSVLNHYWMYMDSTITTSNGDFSTADQGNVGAGDWIKIVNGGHFKTPTSVGGTLTATDGKAKNFDSSLWVMGNASFTNTNFNSALSKVQFDGTFDYSSNGGTDNSPTWIGGKATFYQNTKFQSTLSMKADFYYNSTAPSFAGQVSFDPAIGANDFLAQTGIPTALQNKTTSYSRPFTVPVFFDSTKLPGFNLSFSVPASPEAITASYGTDVCGKNGVICNNYPGVSSGTKSIAAGGKVLPPGYYGSVVLYSNETLILGEGIYYFDKIDLQNSGAKIVAYQPTGERTIVYTKNGLAAHSGGIFMGPDSGYLASKFGVTSSADDFSGGTMMVVAGPYAGISFDSDAQIWATLSAPTGKIYANSQLTLYGQMFARHFEAANNFNGGAGKFVPFYPDPPVISFDVLVFSAKVSEPDLLADKVTPDTVVARFPLKMSHINGATVVVWYHTAPVTATSVGSPGSGFLDYVPVTKGSVSIPATFDTASINIAVLGDIVYEGNETFKVVLDSVTNGSLGPLPTDSSGIGTIIDNDNALKVKLVADGVTKMVRPWAADSAFHYLIQTVDPLTGSLVNTKVPVTVKLKLVPVANATAAMDYQLTTLTYSFSVGDGSIPVRVTIPKSDLFGPDRVFKLVLDSAYGATKADSVVFDTLTSPPVKLVVGDASANQATATSLSLPVQLVRLADGTPVKSSVALPFTWETKDSTAKAGVHYTAIPAGTAGTFPANTLTGSVSVALLKNPQVDSTRYLKAILTPGTYKGLSTAKDTAVGAIQNGYAKPALLMNDTTVARKSSDFVLKLPVRLSQGMTYASSYSFKAVDGGAVNGVDYALVAGSSTIAGSDTIVITIKASAQLDSSRRFYVTIPTWDLTKLSPTPTSDTVAVVTLTNAVTGARLLVDSSSADQSKSSAIRFPVRLVDALGNPLTTRIPVPYTYSTIDGSAKGGTHFAAASGKLDTLAAGGSVDTFSVALLPTQKYDTTRHFQVDVAPVSGLGGMSNLHDSAVGTIVNGFAKPVIHIDPASIVRPKAKTPLSFKVWLDRASAIDLPFAWSTRNGSAVADTDYVGVKDANATVRDSVFLPVSIFARPGEYDTTRHFNVDLSSLAAFANTSASNVGTILPLLGQPYLVALPASVMEGPDGKDTAMVFKIELRDSTGAAMTTRIGASFTWKTQDSVATRVLAPNDSIARIAAYATVFPADYAAVAAGAATVSVGSGSANVTVTVHGNDYRQPDRVLSILLQTATQARLGSVKTGLGTILDDDSSSTRAYFPVATRSVPESLSVVWVPVRLLPVAVVGDTLQVNVDTRSTAVRGTNFELLQSGSAFQGDTSVVPGIGAAATTVKLTVKTGDTLLWVPVLVKRDSVRTADLKILLNLTATTSNGLKVDPGRAQTELVLVNTDPAPYLGFRDTVVRVVRGQSLDLKVGIRALPSEKDPSAQYTGAVSDTSGTTTAIWSGFVSTAKEGSTPGFVNHRLDTTMAFATVNDGRDGPDIRAVLRLHDWTPGEALQPLSGDAVLHDSVVVWITNGNSASKVSFAQKTLTVKDVDGQAAIKLLLDRASWWSTGTSVKGTSIPADVALTADSSVVLHFAPGDSVASFVLRFGNNHKVGANREFDLHLASFLHLAPGADSVLHIVITNTNAGPKVKITSPAENAALGKKDLDAAGKVPVAWTVDGKVQIPYDTLLPEGRSTITKCFADEWGNIGCDSVHVTLDTTAPKVVVTHISKDSGKTWIAVSATDTPWVNKPGILVKWISIDKGDTLRHQDSETLKDSITTVPRCIEDAVGNKGCGSQLVGLDTLAPKVWIVTPPYGSHWSAGCVQTVWYEQDGDKIVRHDTTFCFSTIGPATITVVSSPDRAGNVGKASTLIYIDPNSPSSAIYVDTDHDGRIDAVVVQFPRAWTDSLPTFDISYGAPGENALIGQKATYGTASQVGTVIVLHGDSVRVVAGTPVLGASGQQVISADGTPLYQSSTGTPLMDQGKQVTDKNGVPLWKVTASGSAVDSSVLVVKLATPFPYGWTSSTVTDLGILHATVTTVDSAGKKVKSSWADTFDIKDGVAPVILESRIIRTESYTGKDTLIVQLSEVGNVTKTSGTGILEISTDGGKTWVAVDADTLTATGTIRVLLEPGKPGTPAPGVLIRIAGNITDLSGNKATSATSPSVVVFGAARPDLVEVKSPATLFEVPSNWSTRPLKGGFTFLASPQATDTSRMSAYVPGQGYTSSSVTDAVCPDLGLCAATNIYVNRPSSVQMFVYDMVGTYVAKTMFNITKADLAMIQKDKLDRARLQILWNLRDESGRQVVSGVYLIRMVIRYTDENKVGAAMDNFVLHYGVKIK